MARLISVSWELRGEARRGSARFALVRDKARTSNKGETHAFPRPISGRSARTVTAKPGPSLRSLFPRFPRARYVAPLRETRVMQSLCAQRDDAGRVNGGNTTVIRALLALGSA